MRCAAASVSRITCGRGRRGLGVDAGVEPDDIWVMSMMWSVAERIQYEFCKASTYASPHIEDEAGLVAHALGRPRRLPDDLDVDHADAGDAGDRVLDHGRQLAGGRADWVSIGLALISAVSLIRTNPAPSAAPVPDDRLLLGYYTCRTTPGMWP